MNNKYIFYPPINFDMVKIRDIVSRNLKVEIPGLATHQRKIENEPYLLELQKQYSFFSDLYNIYATPPGYCTPIHICPGRGCAINIPITYTEDSYTIFYDLPGKVEKLYSVNRIYEIIESDAVEVVVLQGVSRDQHTLDTAGCGNAVAAVVRNGVVGDDRSGVVAGR